MNTQKYIDIVHQNSAGTALLQGVEDNWPQWVDIVELSPWLHSWRYWRNKHGRDNLDLLARRIFFSGVWGYGWELWQPGTLGVGCGERPAQPTKSRTRRDGSLACLAALQGTKSIGAHVRTYVWDSEFMEVGELVPCEFATMDRWLESLLCL